MKKNLILIGGLFGGGGALVVVALSYLLERLAGLPRPAFAIFDWLVRVLPGALVTFAIDSMVVAIDRLGLGPTSEVAKLVEQILAVALFVLIGALFGALLGAFGRRAPEKMPGYGMVAGLVLAAMVSFTLLAVRSPAIGPLFSALWLAFLFVNWGGLLGRTIQVVARPEAGSPQGLSRRGFLYLVGIGSFSVLASAAGVSLLEGEEQAAQREPEELLANTGRTSGPAASPPQSELAARQPPVPGTRPELTANRDFYRIDINTRAPEVDGASWQLRVEGLVERSLDLSLEDIRARPAVSQTITLECISNQLGGDLISTSVWTGVRLKDILAEAGLQEGAQEVYIESVDGFYESVPMADAMDDRTLLVYEMNGEPLPAEHGYPLRIYIPNRFGMKQPKWITRMEVIDHAGAGYWVERGWSEEAIPPTTSVIDTVRSEASDLQSGRVPVGGIAFAGARGISRVEVQVDDGPWEAAELRTPPLSPLTWVQWRYEWEAQPGRHLFRVRAYDGQGELQETESSPPHPDGATGIHERSGFIASA